MRLIKFLRGEDGAITIDWTVLVAGLVGVGLIITVEVAQGLENVTDDYDGINTGEGMMTMFVSSPDSMETTVEPEEEETVASADNTDTCDGANPGNDKCVGNASETPNDDEDAWGDGSNGQSDAHDDDDDDSGNGGSNNNGGNGGSNSNGGGSNWGWNWGWW